MVERWDFRRPSMKSSERKWQSEMVLEILSSMKDPSEICLNVVGIVVGLTLFLLAQLVIVFTVGHVWMRRGRRSKGAVGLGEDPLKNVFNPYANRR